MTRSAILMDTEDNVATALRDLHEGEKISIDIEGDGTANVVLQEPIMFGHKFAIRDIKGGEDIIKYGEVIGRATEYIKKGSHVHVHNIKSLRAGQEA